MDSGNVPTGAILAAGTLKSSLGLRPQAPRSRRGRVENRNRASAEDGRPPWRSNVRPRRVNLL